MIKDVMVSLDGTPADEIRLAAVTDIAEYFPIEVTGLFLNMLPAIGPAEWDGLGARQTAQILAEARETSDELAAGVERRLKTLQLPVRLRRIDVAAGTQGHVAAQEARAADVFVGLRPNGIGTDSQLIENVLFETGRHIYLVPEDRGGPRVLDHIVLAWNGTREATRAVAEAMPYLMKAKTVDVVVVQDTLLATPVPGPTIVEHLLHHGVGAQLYEVRHRAGGVAATLIAEARERKADLIVMGGYGHSRLREWLLGGVTHQLMHETPVPLVLAH